MAGLSSPCAVLALPAPTPAPSFKPALEPNELRLVRTPHPLTTQGQLSLALLRHENQSLAELLAEHDIDEAWVVEVGGLEVPCLMWGRTHVKSGQIIEARRRVHGEDPFRAIAFLAVAFAAPYLAGYMGFTAGSIAFTAVTAAITFVGSALINQVLPPPKAARMDLASNTVEPTYSLSGGLNSSRAWQPLALVLGQPYAVFDLAAQPYTYFSGEDQYLTQAFHLGVNCQRVSDLRIGQTSILTYSGVSLFGRNLQSSIPGGLLNPNLPSTNVDSIEGALLTAPAGPGAWTTRTSSANAVMLWVDLEATLYATNTTNGAWQSKDLDLDIQIAPAGSGAWTNVQTSTTRVSITVTGGYDGDGNYTETASTSTTPAPAGKVWLTGSSSKPVRVSVQIPVAQGQYDVRLRKVNADETSTSAQNVVSWNQLRTVQADSATYAGQGILAVTIKASGQLSGSIDDLNGILTAKPMPHWNGGAWVTATDRSNGLSNPGSILLAYARGFYDSSGSLLAGLGWPDSRINIDSLKAFTVWCTSRGFTFDAYVQEAMTHEELMAAVAYAGMGSISMADGRFGVCFLDPAQPIEGVINMGNIKARTFAVQYASTDRADEIEYGYFDRAASNTWNSLRVLAPGVTMPRSTARLSNLGITSEAHAAVLARNAMAQNIYMAKSIEFEQDLEYITYDRGTVLALSHDVTQWGYSGRVQSATQTAGVVTLALDDAVPAGASPYIGLRLPGEAQYRVFTVVAFTGAARSVSLVGAWPSGVALPAAQEALWIYDFKATPGQKVVVTSIDPSEDQGGAKVTVAPLPDEFWPYVFTGAYTPPPNRSLLTTQASVSTAEVTEILSRQGNTFSTRLELSIGLGQQTAQVQVWGAANGELLRQLGSTSTGSFVWEGGLNETWQLRLVPYNGLGQAGTVYTLNYVVQGLKTPPAAPSGQTLTIESAGIRLSWAASSDADYGETIVKIGSSWMAAPLLGRISGTTFLMPHQSAGVLVVWLAHVDTTGNVSSPVSATLTIAAPLAPASLVLSVGTASVEAVWLEPSVSSLQQPLSRVELSWTPGFTAIIDAKRANTATFGWLTAATYTLYARYVDAAGNAGAVSASTLQVLPPAQPVMTAVETQLNAVTLRWQDAKTSQPIRKYAIYFGEAGTPLASTMLYGSAGADSRSDIVFFRSSGPKVVYLVAEDVAGNLSAARQIDLTITMPNDFVLATEYYEDWQTSELTNGSIVGGANGQIILPAFEGRTWGQRLSNNGWTTAQQKIDAGFPIVVQPVPASGKHVEQRDLGKVLAFGVVRVQAFLQSSVAGYTATVRIRASHGNSSITWQPWLTGESASFSNFRFVEVEYSVASDGKGFVVLDDLYVRIEISEITESATLMLSAGDAGGTPYITTKGFLDILTVQATPLGSSNIARLNCIVDDASMPARVLVQAWDATNSRTGGTVSVAISGF